jgi:trimethylamine--corrinoid protein Co-methyltransferase
MPPIPSRELPYQLEATDPADIEAIHAASLSVLADTGAVYENPEAVQLLAQAGASISDHGRVRLPPELVEQAIATAPKAVKMYNRLGEEALQLENGYVYYGTGSDCPNVWDFGTGERRRAVKKDVETFTRLSDALPEIDFILSMAIASDVPTPTADLHHFQAMLYNTTKPIFYTVVNDENNQVIIDLAGLVAGSPQALRDRPFIANFGMPSPPLRHSKSALNNLIGCARQSIPAVYASGTQMGTSGPMAIAGATVSSNCDVLSGLVVHQLANPGAPFIYGVCVPPIDMHTTIECYGAPEHYIGDLVNVRIAQRYGLPTWGYAADTDSKTLDLQAAIEYLGSSVMGLLSGCNLLHDVGYLESGMSASCESIVFGNEVVAFARRIVQPVVVNQEMLATEIIKKVGPGGTFMTEMHTFKHFRDFWYSPLIDRSRHESWVETGRLSMADRIHKRTADLLASHIPSALDSFVVRSIDEHIAELDKAASLSTQSGLSTGGLS